MYQVLDDSAGFVNRETEILNDFVEITLPDAENFLKIRETLTRIGIASKKSKTLFQSCYILHKKGKYYIVHFKEMFKLDGKPSTFDEKDRARRNTIVSLLWEWNLLDIIDEEKFDSDVQAHMNEVKIIPFKDKQSWSLVQKYSMGKNNGFNKSSEK